MANLQANTAYLGWFVLAAYWNRNAKQQALPIVASNKPKGKCHISVVSSSPFLSVCVCVFLIFDSVSNICLCIAFLLPKYWLSLELWF